MNDDDENDERLRLVPTSSSSESVRDVTPAMEARLLMELAVPTVSIELGLTVPIFLTASHVGRTFGYVYLDAYTLSNLSGNLCTLSLLSGLHSASDTLSPQAFGAGNYRQVGLIAIRAFIGSIAILLPTNAILLLFMNDMLLAMGQDAEASRHAWHYYMIYVLSLPFYSLYMVTWKFLSAQSVMWPLLTAAFFGCVIVLPLSLEVFTRRFGFRGAALAIVAYEASQCIIVIFLLWWKQPHHPLTWPGIGVWREAIEWQPLKEFMLLGFGGMLASLEWIYWEALALIVGTLGVLPLSVHTIPTQVLTVTFMIPLGIGIALAVRIGSTLPRNVSRAKNLAVVSLWATTFAFALLSICMFIFQERIFAIFTDEEDVVIGSKRIWGHVCFYNFLLGMFGTIMGIATGLGMQWTLGVVTLFFLWVFGLPVAYYAAIIRQGGIEAAWLWIWPPYLGINIVMSKAVFQKDWQAIANEIKLREAVPQRPNEDRDAPQNYGSTQPRSNAAS